MAAGEGPPRIHEWPLWGISIPLASATPVRAFFVVSGGLAGVDAGFITATMLLTGFVLIVLTLSIGVDIVSLEPAQGLITFSRCVGSPIHHCLGSSCLQALWSCPRRCEPRSFTGSRSHAAPKEGFGNHRLTTIENASLSAMAIGLPLLIRIDSLSAAMTRLVSVG